MATSTIFGTNDTPVTSGLTIGGGIVGGNAASGNTDVGTGGLGNLNTIVANRRASYGQNSSGTTGTGNAATDAGAAQIQTYISTAEEQAAIDAANAKALAASETGYRAESTAYGQVGNIATNNAGLAQASGDITAYQDLLKAQQTIGEQKAGVAASGFRESGTSLDLLAGSMRQSTLTQQLDMTQTAINVGGYLSEKAAADAQQAAADAAAGNAAAMQTGYETAGSLATTEAATLTKQLKDFISSGTSSTGTNVVVKGGGSSSSSGTSKSVSIDYNAKTGTDSSLNIGSGADWLNNANATLETTAF